VPCAAAAAAVLQAEAVTFVWLMVGGVLGAAERLEAAVVTLLAVPAAAAAHAVEQLPQLPAAPPAPAAPWQHGMCGQDCSATCMTPQTAASVAGVSPAEAASSCAEGAGHHHHQQQQQQQQQGMEQQQQQQEQQATKQQQQQQQQEQQATKQQQQQQQQQQSALLLFLEPVLRAVFHGASFAKYCIQCPESFGWSVVHSDLLLPDPAAAGKADNSQASAGLESLANPGTAAAAAPDPPWHGQVRSGWQGSDGGLHMLRRDRSAAAAFKIWAAMSGLLVLVLVVITNPNGSLSPAASSSMALVPTHGIIALVLAWHERVESTTIRVSQGQGQGLTLDT